MLWTCVHCGFYNDAPGDCCNCGKGQQFHLETHDAPDLLSSTYDLNAILTDDKQKGEKSTLNNNTHKNEQLDAALSIDHTQDASALLDAVDNMIDSDDEQQQPKVEDNPGESTLIPIQDQSTTPNVSDAYHTTLSISPDHYNQSATLRYSILNYHFFRIFLFYISSNLILTLASIFIATITVITALAITLEFKQDSAVDKFADFAAYVWCVSYLLYLCLLFPAMPFFFDRGASLWAKETPVTNSTAFVDYLSSHAPALTTPQLDAITNHFVTVQQQQGNDVIAFVHIPPQFRTRSAVIGIHYIPHISEFDNDPSPNANLLSEPNSSTHPPQTSSNSPSSYFLQSWSEQSTTLKVLKICQIISFIFVLEPILTPLLLSCTGARTKKYGVKIVNIKNGESNRTNDQIRGYGSQTRTTQAQNDSNSTNSNGYANYA